MLMVCYLPHDVPEVSLVLDRKHANEFYLQFHEVAIVEIDVVDHLHIYVLILVDEIRIKVLEQHYVPVYNNLTSICLILLFVWQL